MNVVIDASEHESTRAIVEYEETSGNHSFVFEEAGLTLTLNYEQMRDLFNQMKPWFIE